MVQEKCRQLTSSTPRYGVIFGHNVNIQSIDKAVPMSGSLSKTPDCNNRLPAEYYGAVSGSNQHTILLRKAVRQMKTKTYCFCLLLLDFGIVVHRVHYVKSYY